MRLIPAFIHRRIAHRPNLVRIVDNIGWLFFDKILRMGVGLLVGVWIARYLGPEQFGLINFAFAFTGLFGTIAGLGLQSIVVRDIVRDPESARLTLGTAAILQLIGGLVSFLLILGVIAHLRPDDPLARSIVAILGAMMLLKTSEIAVYWFESQVQSKYTVWVQNSVFLVFASVKVGLILQHAPIITFVWAMFAETVAVAFILITVMGLYGPTLKSLRVSSVRAKALLKDSWPLALSGIAVMIYMKIDQIMLGQMIGDEAVGIYSAALRISEVWYFMPITIAASLLPAIIESKKIGELEYYYRLTRLLRLLIVTSISVAIPVTFTSNLIIEILYGYKYAGAGPVLAIHVWTGIFVCIGIVSGKWFLVESKQIYSLYITILAALLNIILNLTLIPSFGTIGAATATLMSFAIANLVWPMLFNETKPLAKIILSSIRFGTR